MAEIFGLVEGEEEASVELYLRVTRCWRRELEARIGALLARSWRAQHWAAYLHERAMAVEPGQRRRVVLGSRRDIGLLRCWGGA